MGRQMVKWILVGEEHIPKSKQNSKEIPNQEDISVPRKRKRFHHVDDVKKMDVETAAEVEESTHSRPDISVPSK